ncbi:hypothetical protein MBOT_06980 [Mycobacterium botniense]|uniref:Uncharacterized protein n=1 Tax=Mycobacterium botniense TaxID=84962 RepID=A0A7I9XTJ4_9MYCO|nr:hypothetical protein MBOT_06980 [Mycobacterium botniense]
MKAAQVAGCHTTLQLVEHPAPAIGEIPFPSTYTPFPSTYIIDEFHCAPGNLDAGCMHGRATHIL